MLFNFLFHSKHSYDNLHCTFHIEKRTLELSYCLELNNLFYMCVWKGKKKIKNIYFERFKFKHALIKILSWKWT